MLATGLTKPPHRLALFALLAMTASPLAAHELDTMVGIEVERSDNIGRLPRGQEVEEDIARPTLRTEYQLDFTRLQGSLNYKASRTDYRDNYFPDRTDVVGEGNLRWSMIHDRLDWNVYHNRSRLTLDAQGPETPRNETIRSVTSTGPTLTFQFSGRSQMRVSADYVESTLDADEATDSTQRRYAVDLTRTFGAQTDVGLLAEYSDVRLDVDILDYETSRAALRLDGSGDKFQYQIHVGKNKVDRRSGTSYSGTLLSLSAVASTASTTWQISAVRELTDSTTGLTLNEDLMDRMNTGDTNFNDADIVERSRAEISWRIDAGAGRTSLRLAASFDRQDFQESPGDEDLRDATIELRYRPSGRLTLGYAYQWREREPQNPGDILPIDTDRIHRLDWGYNPNPRLHLALLFSDRDRTSSIAVREFRERTIGLTLEYRI